MEDLEKPPREIPLMETDRGLGRHPDQTVGPSVGEEIRRLFDEFNNTLKAALVPNQKTVQRPRASPQTDDLKATPRVSLHTGARMTLSQP